MSTNLVASSSQGTINLSLWVTFDGPQGLFVSPSQGFDLRMADSFGTGHTCAHDVFGNPGLEAIQAMQSMLLEMMIEYFATFLSAMAEPGRDLGSMPSAALDIRRDQGATSRTRPGAATSGAKGTTEAVPSTSPTGKGTSGDFLKAALAQKGDRYIWGAETRMSDPDPDAFDCSELVEWAAAQAGVKIPDGSWAQADACKKLSVEEAIRTPGALLFKKGHVAISLGDGRTIEAMGRKYGVVNGNARGRFTSGGLIPGMQYG